MATVAQLLTLLLNVTSGVGNGSNTEATEAQWTTAEASGPWPKTRVIRGLDTFWEVPLNPIGVLFAAHGCNHQGSDFWPQSEQCEQCLGLPEELLVRSTALQRGYALIAVSSYDRERKCWDNTEYSRSDDLQRLPSVLRAVIDEEQLEELPLFLFGASSGGGIVQRLTQIMPEVQGVIAEITPVRLEVFDVGQDRTFPPVLFVHMAPQDESFADSVAEGLAYCRRNGIPADEIRVYAQPVTADLMQRSPQISSEEAEAIVDALSKGGLVDEEGFLLEDPRAFPDPWQEALEPVVGNLTLEADVSQVSQLLNVAYAKHELVGEPVDLALTWLEAGGQTSIEVLVEEAQAA